MRPPPLDSPALLDLDGIRPFLFARRSPQNAEQNERIKFSGRIEVDQQGVNSSALNPVLLAGSAELNISASTARTGDMK